MKLYLDASVLVPLFVEEALTARSREIISNQILLVSSLARAEFSSAIARRVRMGDIPSDVAADIFDSFDIWTAARTTLTECVGQDFDAATDLVRRLDLGLRTPDALNIAIARRCEVPIATFDGKMTAAALRLGLHCISTEAI